MRTRYALGAIALALAGGFSLGFSGCNEDGTPVNCSAQVYDPRTGTNTLSPINKAGFQVGAILNATTALVKAADEIDTELLTTCTAMATQLGIPAAQLAAPPSDTSAGAATKAACGRVKTEVENLLRANLKANAYLEVNYVPAQCMVSASFQLECVNKCEQQTYTETQIMCKPGKVVYPMWSAMCSGSCEGSCSAQCTGSCSATCTGTCGGKCTGSCQGTCTGSCGGTCMGKCNGTCSAMNADGSCAGTCNGTCEGTCMGTCSGSCSAQCTGKCEGSCTGGCNGSCTGGCTGSCTGSCRADFIPGSVTPPICEERVVTKEREVCETNCNAEASAKASCTEPMLTINAGAGLVVDQAKVDLVIATFKTHGPKLFRLAKRAALVVSATGETYATNLSTLPATLGAAGLQAAGCVAAAANYASSAFAKVSVSAQVSVSVSASVSATGTAGGSAAAGTTMATTPPG